MNQENNGIQRPLRKFVPTPIEVDVTKMCDKICDREMRTCFDPTLSVVVYDGTSPEKMRFEQKFKKFSPKIDTEEAENKWKHYRSKCPVNELDETFHTMTKQESCAIVGNSGILLGSKCGEEIDSHGFVLRTNLALLEGYTKDVGNKTNMMMINFSALCRIYLTLRKQSKAKDDMLRYFELLNGTILWYPKVIGGRQSSRLQQIATLFLEENMHFKFAYNLMSASLVTKQKWRTPRVASSGLITFTRAQTFCKNVTLYGFYPYQRDEFGVPVLYHYYEPNLIDFHTRTHNFDREHRLLRSLHDQHILKLVIGSCKK
ncbi:Alpha-2,8-sialyltransferase 8B [Holothuria leucospilota]|uniref:Alpha-2,8-sialyltransferase 8B n=1 Tax=Holothuria leucospilota TaxID=206669 RepID=A0A9Q1HKG9_HOLLE|nr:Alpha-2,8-sialyltransferase 8B [Holothuria leucospilota]